MPPIITMNKTQGLIKDYPSARDFFITKFNKKLIRFLPKNHPPTQIYHDPALYYEKLNGIYLRKVARSLLAKTSQWSIHEVMNFVPYIFLNIPERSLQMSSIFYMMYHYHEISDEISNLNIFKNWIETGLFDKDSLVDFCEYCLMPFINDKQSWIALIINWAKDPHPNIRRASALAIRKCAIDKNKAPLALEVCRLLLDNCEEKEIQNAIGQVMRQVGKKRKAMLRAFLEEHLHRIPRNSLRAGLARMSRKEQDYYMMEHEFKAEKKRNKKHKTLILMESFEKSLGNKKEEE
ncbi:unnamed protein product [Blepharisma stoltei]|uniref:HEAT repeat domain-containing protein n=1 Tax=Blepharisma stoltei TaxID=1481888 RepID=A0AAU9IE81_9CILI|nr:unnamed protein product [Blepharisma stoltei]